MQLLVRSAPVLFVVLWSSAFVGARYGLPYAEPLTFLALRFALVTAIFLLLALVSRAPWPDSAASVGHIALVGLLVQGLYLSGTFVAIDLGVPLGIVTLILGLQPVLTMLWVWMLPDGRIRGLQACGIALGFAGLVLVLWDRMEPGPVGAFALLPVVIGLICMTAGTLHQRRYCANMNLVTGAAIQSATAMLACGFAAWAFEDMRVDWNVHFIGALAWMVIVVSLGAHTLLLFLLRHTQAIRVASLLYLTPPVTALMALAMFGEALSLLALAGLVVTVAGVALTTRE